MDVAVAAVLDSDPGSHPFLLALAGDGVGTRPLVLPPRAYREEWRGLRRIIREVGPDLVHTHGARGDVVGGWAARAEGVPWVATAHGFTGGDRRNRLYEWLQRRSYRLADAAVAVAEPVRGRIVASGVPAARVVTIRNGWAPTGTSASRAEARERLGLAAGDFVIGWVGRVTREKALDLLLTALPRLQSGVTLAVLGDGRERPMLEAAAGAASGTVVWCGEVPEAGRWFQAFDLLVLSSRTEGTPMVLFEAMAAGIPIVATNVGGVPDVLDDACAWLVPPEDPAALATAIDAARGDPAERTRRSARAAERLRTEFGVEPWVAAYAALYTRVLGARAAR